MAIADVSHYVRPGTALDQEAYNRSTSVYFPERVIPMLPEILSNGLCSLNPKVDRLCQVCEIFFSASGEVTSFRFFDGVMRSAARLTYTEVAEMVVEQSEPVRQRYAPLLPALETLYTFYKVLRKKRKRRGAIDFETTETAIVFGEDRKIECIVPVVRNEAHKIIEECMIAANVCAAQHLLQKKLPALYRVHKGPTGDKLTNLRAFLSEIGMTLQGGDDPQPKHYAELLDSVGERPDAHLIQTVMLRSLSQAVYSPENIGHFGLAFGEYAHFTSPIRRYPDLLIHRALRHANSAKGGEPFRYDLNAMLVFGEHCSMNERRADDATRDAVDWLKCEYMMERVGEKYDGIITAVTSFGLFVELDEIYVEGLVHITALSGDYYHFDPVKHRLLGERSNRSYRLGDKISIRVVRVDLDQRKVDFELADGQKAKPKSKSKLKSKSKRASKAGSKKKQRRRAP